MYRLIYWTVTCLFVCLYLSSCGKAQNSQEEARGVAIKGTIHQAISDTVVLVYLDDVMDLSQSNGYQYHYATLDSNNHFSIELDWTSRKPEVYLVHGQQNLELYVTPGMELFLEVDGRRFNKSPNFLGSGALANNFLSHYIAERLKDAYALKEPEKTLVPKAYLEYVEDRWTWSQDYLKDNPLKDGLDEGFIEYYKQQIDYNWATLLLQYAFQNRMRPKEMQAELPKNYFDFLDRITIENDKAIGNRKYSDFLREYVGYNSEAYFEAVRKQPIDYKELVSILVSNTKKKLSGKAYEYAAARTIKEVIDYHFPEEAYKEHLDAFRKAYPKSPYLDKIETSYVVEQRMRPNMMAPDFRYVNQKGDSIALGDLTGKIVFMSFWNADCIDCLQEFDVLRKFQPLLPNDRVSFVYVNVGDSSNVFMQQIRDLNLNGEHILVPSNDKMIDNYHVTQLPRYVILNTNGTFISAYAPRPSGGAYDVLQTIVKELVPVKEAPPVR